MRLPLRLQQRRGISGSGVDIPLFQMRRNQRRFPKGCSLKKGKTTPMLWQIEERFRVLYKDSYFKLMTEVTLEYGVDGINIYTVSKSIFLLLFSRSHETNPGLYFGTTAQLGPIKISPLPTSFHHVLCLYKGLRDIQKVSDLNPRLRSSLSAQSHNSSIAGGPGFSLLLT